MTTNQSSNRNDLNAGSDTGHKRDTGKEAYEKASKTGAATPITGTHPNGFVGNKPGKGPADSDAK